MSLQLTRRSLLGSILGGTVSLALSPTSIARFGPAHGIVSLTSNENPYGPSAGALKAAAEATAKSAYYPGMISRELTQLIADRHGLATENIVLSSGSNEALCAAATGWAKRGSIVTAALTYDLHLGFAAKIGAEVVRVPLNSDMSINLDSVAAAVDNSVSLVYICNPNNPTGMTLDGDVLRDFCRTIGRQATVIVDEAYNELTEDPNYTSMVDLVREGENVIVMRTFSKLYGMAGLRVGYGIGRPDLVARVGNYITSWPNVVGLAAAHASYNDEDLIRFSTGKIVQGRKMVIDTFKRHGLQPLPAQTNFVFTDIGRNVDAFGARMRERNVRVHRAYPGYETYMRVSMGKLEELEIFSDVFSELYSA